jgi:hypothetical protein
MAHDWALSIQTTFFAFIAVLLLSYEFIFVIKGEISLGGK